MNWDTLFTWKLGIEFRFEELFDIEKSSKEWEPRQHVGITWDAEF